MSWAEERRARRNERRAAEPTAANIDFLDDGAGLNPFAESVDAGHGMDPRMRKVFVAGVALAAVFAIGLLLPQEFVPWLINRPRSTGSFLVDVASWVSGQASDKATYLIAIFADPGSMEAAQGRNEIIVELVVAMAGAGLALSGAVYQGVFRNALVAPSTLGVMTGGTFGAMLWAVAVIGGGAGWGDIFLVAESGSTDPFDYVATSFGMALCSFAGCVAVVALVLLTLKAAGAQKTSGIMMIITGQVIGGIIGVVSTAIRYYYVTVDPYGDLAYFLRELQIASFYRPFSWLDVVIIFVTITAVFLLILRMRQRMMLLAFDEAEQRTLGVDTRRMQVMVVGAVTLLTAVIVSFCGAVGFVGFLVPHLSRRFVGPNFKQLLPMSMVVGALFVLGAYLLVQLVAGPDYAQMTGTFISMFGAAVFLATVLRKGAGDLGTFK